MLMTQKIWRFFHIELSQKITMFIYEILLKEISLEKTLIYLRPAIGKSLEQLEFMSF